MAFDGTKVDLERADLFYHGGPPDENGEPRPLSDEEWDAQKAEARAQDAWPYDHLPPEEDE